MGKQTHNFTFKDTSL